MEADPLLQESEIKPANTSSQFVVQDLQTKGNEDLNMMLQNITEEESKFVSKPK